MIDGVKNDFAAALGYVFSTFPVIASYDDGQGSSGSFSYPRPGNAPPAPVHADPSGDVSLNWQVWLPQRRRIEGEPGDAEWMDVGSLSYTAQVASPSGGIFCPQSSFSTADPNLAPITTSPSPERVPAGLRTWPPISPQTPRTRSASRSTYTVPGLERGVPRPERGREGDDLGRGHPSCRWVPDLNGVLDQQLRAPTVGRAPVRLLVPRSRLR